LAGTSAQTQSIANNKHFQPIFLSHRRERKSLPQKIVSLSKRTESPWVRNFGHQWRWIWQSLVFN